MPMPVLKGSALKTICSPSPLVWGHNHSNNQKGNPYFKIWALTFTIQDSTMDDGDYHPLCTPEPFAQGSWWKKKIVCFMNFRLKIQSFFFIFIVLECFITIWGWRTLLQVFTQGVCYFCYVGILYACDQIECTKHNYGFKHF